MSLDTDPPSIPARRKLTDTTVGQSVFVGLWIVGTLGVLAAITGAFVVGQSVASGAGDSDDVVVAEPIVHEPVVFTDLTGPPQAPGTWEWSDLRGGECIAGFEGAFAEEFTVVACTEQHEAQLLRAELLSRDPGAFFPGVEDTLAQARNLCDVRELIDYLVAGDYADLMVDYSYPVTAEQWDRGERGVYCFVTRQSGGQLVGNLIP